MEFFSPTVLTQLYIVGSLVTWLICEVTGRQDGNDTFDGGFTAMLMLLWGPIVIAFMIVGLSLLLKSARKVSMNFKNVFKMVCIASLVLLALVILSGCESANHATEVGLGGDQSIEVYTVRGTELECVSQHYRLSCNWEKFNRIEGEKNYGK